MATSNHDEFPGEVAQPQVGSDSGSSYFGTLLNSATDYAIIATDEHGLITTWNLGARNVFGWSEDEALGQSAALIFTPEDRASGAHEQEMVIARQDGRAIDERWHIKKDGTHFWASGVLMPVRSGPGGFLKILRDLTETKRQRMAAKQASDRADRLLAEQGVQTKVLETLLSTGVRIASELDLDKLLQTVTDAGVELTGAQFGAFFYNTTDESGGKYMLYTLSGAERSKFENLGMPRATQVFAPTFHGEGVIRSDDILIDPRYGKNAPHSGMPNGHLPVRSYLAVSVYSRTREVVGGLFFGHSDPGIFKKSHEDLAAGIAAQAAIAIDNARLFRDIRRLNDTLEARVAERTAERDRIWRLSTDMMLVARFDGTIESINPAWTEFLGWPQDELIGRRFFDFVHPEDLEATSKEAESLAAGLRTERFENRYKMKSGNYIWVSWVAFPEGQFIHAIGRDVSAEKAAQAELAMAHEQLRQAQKMEAVGQLTGGIAHDFNNMLAVVIGSLDLLGRRIGADPRARRYIDAAAEGAKRAALLTQRLLAFSRQQPLQPETVDANKLVGGMSELMRRSLGPDVRLETVLAGGLWRTFADPNQLESAILNLSVNARDAMPEGGRLTIETQNAHLDERYVAAEPTVTAGQYVLIAVSDTGAGMPADVLAKAFDPFFTTKEVGKGTGLGLSQVYGFVKQSGGHVKIYSELGEGTTVKLYMPRYRGTDAAGATEVEEAPPPGDDQELILVVEDEPSVRQFSVDALTELGYRVLEAENATAGLSLIDAHPDISLLFTDVVMPEINGRKLADEALRLRPDLRVLFTTGYTRNAVVHNGVLDEGVHLIGKPFSINELAAKVREVLDERKPQS